MLILALAAAAGTSAMVAWLVDQRRCRRRNRQGECAACGVAWAETPSGDPYLIHGRLICEDCAEVAKRRMPWHFGILAAATAFSTGYIVAGEGVVADVLFPVGSTIVMILGAVQLMKLANRNAQRRIAGGEFPDFDSLGGEPGTGPRSSLADVDGGVE